MFCMENCPFLQRSNGKDDVCILQDTPILVCFPCYDRHLHVRRIFQLVRRDQGMGESLGKLTEHTPFQLLYGKEYHLDGNMNQHFLGNTVAD